jgi:hypothetical protein
MVAPSLSDLDPGVCYVARRLAGSRRQHRIVGRFPGSHLEPYREGAVMRYKVKNVAALQTLLGGWPDRMRVEVDRDIGVSAKTVKQLRKITEWPVNLTITTPPETESTIKVGKATVATRVSPKA